MNKDNIINDANKLLDKYDTNDFVKMFRLEGFTILMSSLNVIPLHFILNGLIFDVISNNFSFSSSLEISFSKGKAKVI